MNSVFLYKKIMFRSQFPMNRFLNVCKNNIIQKPIHGEPISKQRKTKKIAGAKSGFK